MTMKEEQDMAKQIEISFRPESTEFGIVTNDGSGNGIIVCRGKLAGCDHLVDKEKVERIRLLQQMVAAWNNKHGNGVM